MGSPALGLTTKAWAERSLVDRTLLGYGWGAYSMATTGVFAERVWPSLSLRRARKLYVPGTGASTTNVGARDAFTYQVVSPGSCQLRT